MDRSGADSTSPDGRLAGDGADLELDALDRAIVDELQADGRASMRAVAATLHISRASVYNRVQRLERAGVISGYTAVVDPQRLGQTVAAYVYLNVAQQSWKSIQAKVVDLPEVAGGALVSGDHDIVLLVRTRDAAALRNLVLNELQGMPEVLSTHTVLIFEELAPTADLPSTRSRRPRAGGTGSRRPERAGGVR